MAASDDLDTLARTIFGEARGEPLEGQIAVAWVIRNRTSRGARFGFTISEVCRKPAQFSCWNPDDPTHAALLAANIEQRPFMRSLGVAALVLSSAYPDPTEGADHYFTAAKPAWATEWPPAWSKTMTLTVGIGGHLFYRENPLVQKA